MPLVQVIWGPRVKVTEWKGQKKAQTEIARYTYYNSKLIGKLNIMVKQTVAVSKHLALNMVLYLYMHV